MSHQNQPGGVKVHHARAPVAEESREEVVVSRTSLVPVVEVERAQLPPSPHPGCRALDEAQMNGGPCPEVSEGSGRIIGPSSAAYFRSDGPQVIRCFQVAGAPLGAADSVFAWPLHDFKAATLAHAFAAPFQIKTSKTVKGI